MRIALLFTILLALGDASAASFNCTLSNLNKVENLICTTPDISLKDEILSVLYKFSVESIDGIEVYGFPLDRNIKESQIEWLKARNKCAKAECIANAYNGRISYLLEQNEYLLKLRNKTILRDLISEATGLHINDIYDIDVLWFRNYRGNSAIAHQLGDVYHDQIRSIIMFSSDDPDKPGGSWCGGSNLTHLVFLASDQYNTLMESAHLSNNNCTSGRTIEGIRETGDGPIIGFGGPMSEDFQPVFRIRDFGGSKWFKIINADYSKIHKTYNNKNSYLNTMLRNRRRSSK